MGDRVKGELSANYMITGVNANFGKSGVVLRFEMDFEGNRYRIWLGASEEMARAIVDEIHTALRVPELARSLTAEPQPVPELKYSEAEGVGAGLHDHLENLGLCIVDLKKGQVLDPEAILQRGDLAWADMVQRMLVLAGEKEAERGE